MVYVKVESLRNTSFDFGRLSRTDTELRVGDVIVSWEHWTVSHFTASVVLSKVMRSRSTSRSLICVHGVQWSKGNFTIPVLLDLSPAEVLRHLDVESKLLMQTVILPS